MPAVQAGKLRASQEVSTQDEWCLKQASSRLLNADRAQEHSQS